MIEDNKPKTAKEALEDLVFAIEQQQTYGDDVGVEFALRNARETLKNAKE